MRGSTLMVKHVFSLSHMFFTRFGHRVLGWVSGESSHVHHSKRSNILSRKIFWRTNPSVSDTHTLSPVPKHPCIDPVTDDNELD